MICNYNKFGAVDYSLVWDDLRRSGIMIRATRISLQDSYSIVTFSKSESQAGGARSPFMLLAKLVRYSEL